MLGWRGAAAGEEEEREEWRPHHLDLTDEPRRKFRNPGVTLDMLESVLERGLDTSNGLDFVRERLALVGKTLFLVSFGFYLFLLASMVLAGGAPFVAVVRNPVALGPPLCQLDGGPGLAAGQPSQALEAEPGGARCYQLCRGLQFPVPHDDER